MSRVKGKIAAGESVEKVLPVFWPGIFSRTLSTGLNRMHPGAFYEMRGARIPDFSVNLIKMKGAVKCL